MTDFLGADTAQLRDLAKTFSTSAQRIDAQAKMLRSLVSPLTSWRGPDAARFTQMVNSKHLPLLHRTATTLTEVAAQLKVQADEQDKTSSAASLGAPSGSPANPTSSAAAAELQQRLESMTATEREAYLNSQEFKDWAAQHPDEAKSVLDAMADSGQIQFADGGYANFLEDYWLLAAMQEAGIDPDKWDPAQGYAYNRDTIAAVYKYYGELYLKDPRMQWAGFAHMVGPGLDAGFADVRMMRDVARTLLSSGAVGDALVPGLTPLSPEQLLALANMSDREIAYFETSLLEMQQQIFNDIGYQHQAFAEGGIDEINRMVKAGVIEDPRVIEAWQKFNSGTPEDLAQGTLNMADYEQNVVIAESYDDMNGHGLTGPAFTLAMSIVGTPSIPDAQSYSQANPLILHPTPESVPVGPLGPFGPHFDVPNPLHDNIVVETPLPDGNIANREQRWEFITEDTYPAYMDLANDPGRLESIIEQQVSDTGYQDAVNSNRLTNRWDEVLRQIVLGDGNPLDGK
ncbi:hypothetical protein SAMN04489740_2217 [Arthrobacter alpinus]|uniref:WXG100 family type VII secretion target n=1 Tax=Arthrobacter alpinus TaxID=656366 RepID=A0A1H5KXS0_9MICC|nr:hypothetical protein [Arthrobacter alpinus]SEE69625.1 hypothetical protein SAMN04489740_2217 [Arthrobacter alpinus]